MKPRPTMPILTFAILYLDRLDQLPRGANVRDALRTGLALDAAPLVKTQFLKRSEKRLPIHLAGPDRDFLAPVPSFLCFLAVLDMTLLQPGREGPQRFDRISFIV